MRGLLKQTSVGVAWGERISRGQLVVMGGTPHARAGRDPAAGSKFYHRSGIVRQGGGGSCIEAETPKPGIFTIFGGTEIPKT